MYDNNRKRKMRLFGIAMLAVGSLVISGCFFPPILDGAGRLRKYSAPIGAHYVKPDMTREERLRDWAACGAGDAATFCRKLEEDPQAFAACKGRCKLKSCFTREQIANATIPKEQAAPGDLTDGSLILLGRLYSCMESRGYHMLPLDECSGDQNYFPRCLWP